MAAVLIAILILGAAFYNYVYVPSLPSQSTKLTLVATVDPKDGFWEYKYANDTGIYEEEGLEVQIILVKTPKEMMQAFLAGDVYVTQSVSEPLSAYLTGAKGIRVVSVMARASFALVVKPEVNSIQEVKSVAIPGRGTAGDLLMREYLVAHGVKPDVDVSLQYLAIPTMLPAFLAGQVDAFLGGTSAYPALKAGQGKILFQFAEEFPRYCVSGLTVTEKMIAEKPQVVKAFVKALYRSQVALIQNKEKAIEYAVNVLGLDKDYATFVYEFAFEGKYGAATKMVPDMPLGDLEYTIGMLAKYMDVPAKPIEGVVDTTFMDQVKKELG